MSDTITCTSCSATLPPAAAFCTSCGTPIAAAAPDATRVDNPGLHDATQVYAPPPPAPWQPAESAAPGPPPMPPPAATWTPPPPAAPGPPAWQQPMQPGAPSWGTPVAQAAPPAPKSSGAPLGAVAAIVGGVLSLVGLFTAWVEVTVRGRSESFSGWSLTTGDDLLKSNDPYLILGAALAAIVVGVLLFSLGAKVILRIAAVVAGLVLIATPIRDWLDIADLIEGSPGVEAKQAFGFFLTIAGGVVTVIAAVLPGKRTA